MPTYDLVCRACETSFEIFRLRTLRDDEKVCPECGSTDVKQKLTGGYFSRPTASYADTPCGAPTCSSPGAGGSFG